MTYCDKCYGFLVDFISLPVDEPLAYYVKSKNIPKVADILAKEFYRMFQSIKPLDYYYVVRKSLYSMDLSQKKEKYISDEHVRGMVKLEALLKMSYKDNINYIIFILEENSIIINKDIQLLWLANCVEHIWIHLENIHNEHTGKAPVSYGGPAIGMKSVQNKVLVEKPQEQIVIIELKTQEEKEFDELYN
jgi:hypothetical protein